MNSPRKTLENIDNLLVTKAKTNNKYYNWSHKSGTEIISMSYFDNESNLDQLNSVATDRKLTPLKKNQNNYKYDTLTPSKYHDNLDLINHICPFTPIAFGPKSIKGRERNISPIQKILFDKTKNLGRHELELEEVNTLSVNGETYNGTNNNELRFKLYKKKQYSKSLIDLYCDRDIKNYSILNKRDIKDSKINKHNISINNEFKNTSVKPRYGILDVIQYAKYVVEDANFKKGGRKYSFNTNLNNHSPGLILKDEKIGTNKIFNHNLTILNNNNLKKESYIKTLSNTKNKSNDYLNDLIEKDYEKEKKQWNNLMNKNLGYHFSPEIGD